MGDLPAQHREEKGAVLAGTATDVRTGAPLEGVAVRLEGTVLAALTDSAGRYRIDEVPSGPQVLRAERIGYATHRRTVTVPTTGVLVRDLRLAERALEMADITVTADAASRAEGELGTATVIGRDAIEHLTASSLAGVLELVPGVPVQPPGLEGVQQFSLRSVPTSSGSRGLLGTTAGPSAAELASFGTLILLDGIPVSNNANLQTAGPRGELEFVTAANGGVDLRRIPASTIERLEVIRGIPSVRYGDLTQGAVVVETRAGEVAPEFTARYDARSMEGSGIAGRSFARARQAATLTLDVARTRSAPGLNADLATRVAGQLAHVARVGSKGDGGGAAGEEPALVLDSRLDFFRLEDDRPENPDVRPERSFRSRDTGLRVSERARLRLGEDTRLSFSGAWTRVRQTSTSRAPRVTGALPFSDRLTEGRTEGRFIGGKYVSEVKIEGTPSLFFSRLEAEREAAALGAVHLLRSGLVLRRESTGGEGFQFDISKPPQVRFNGIRGFDRPRSYRGIPPLVTTGLYLDDRLRAPLPGGARLHLQAGLRADFLHAGRWWISGTRDRVLQPRVQAELLPRPWIRVRAGWGRSAKTPSLARLAPPPQYFDLVNVNWFTPEPEERLAVLTTFVEDPGNPELGFQVGRKTEVGVEVGRGDWAVSAALFSDRINGGIGFVPRPGFVLRDRFALSDSTRGTGDPPEIVEPPVSTDTVPVLVDRPANAFDVTSEGIELTASLPELSRLHTRLHLTGSWVRTERSSAGADFGARERFSGFQRDTGVARFPYWDGVAETGKRVLFLYRLVHHRPKIGLVISATVQHNVLDRTRNEVRTDSLGFAGYVTRDGRLVPVPEEERDAPKHADLRRVPRGVSADLRRTPADWMASVRVGKTLPYGGTLTFWAFNFLDRQGLFSQPPDVWPRHYPPVRFGVDVDLPTREFLPW